MIRLVEITSDNWLKIIFLTTNKDGHATITEEFVASNALSIVQSMFEKGWIIKGIQAYDKLVGFAMYGLSEDSSKYEICRFMIDQAFQGKGYGKEALHLVIDELKKISNCRVIFLSTEPENEKARKLYESFGFKETGEMVEDEMEYSLELISD